MFDKQGDWMYIMHLSIVSPTTPHTGMGGDNRGFDYVFCQIPNSWGSFYVKSLE